LFRWHGSGLTESTATSVCALSIAGGIQAPNERSPTAPVPVFLAQAIFASESTVIAVGYEHSADGRLLGIKYCFNRPWGIWELQLPEDKSALPGSDKPGMVLSCPSKRLTSPERSCRSPRLFRNTLFWLSNPVGGAHASCTSLHSLDLTSREEKLLVDSIWEPTGPDAFPGLYPDVLLPAQPFLTLPSGIFVVTQSIWRSRTTVLLISTQTGAVRDLTPHLNNDQIWSWGVLCTDGECRILCTRSELRIPQQIVLGHVLDERVLGWNIINEPVLPSTGMCSCIAATTHDTQACRS
jgi:hypothetical protein